MKPLSWIFISLCYLVVFRPNITADQAQPSSTDSAPATASSQASTSSATQTKPAPSSTEQTPKAELPQQTQNSSTPPGKPVTIPKLGAIFPPVPPASPNEPLKLTGSDFDDNVQVRLIDPQGNVYDLPKDKVLSVTHERVVFLATLGVPGKWKVEATNPGGKSSEPLEVPVGNSQVIDFSSPAIYAFAVVVIVITALIVALFWATIRDLNRSIASHQWSLGEALSEESAFQPKEIRQKSDVILFGSTSRLIALAGLLGILTTVLGIGYAMIWSLFIYGTVPDLSEARSFLYGSACLFAPYLANKVAGIFTPSGVTKPTTTAEAVAVSVTGVGPATPTAAAGFHSGVTLNLTDPAGGSHAVTGADVTSVDTTLVSANVTLNTPGAWKVSVTNPASAPSNAFNFSVLGPPAITNMEAAVTHAAAAQPITFVGSGFMSGLTVSLIDPANAATPVTVTSVTPTRVTVSATIATAGNWQVIVTNPGNHASAPYGFVVA
jgi:hypothetical protein